MRKLGTVILSVMLVACLSQCGVSRNKSSAGAGSNSRYLTLYVSPGVNQYFVKPVASKQNNLEVIIDYSFRDSNDRIGPVTVNFTLISDTLVREVRQFDLIAGGEEVQVQNLSRLFREKRGRDYFLRYTGLLTFEQLKPVFKNAELTYKFQLPDDIHTVSAGKKEWKKRTKVREDLLITLEPW